MQKKTFMTLVGHSRPQLKNPVLRKRRSVKFSGRKCPTSSNRDKKNWEVNVYFFSESFWWWLLIHLPPCAERYWPVAFVTIQSAKPYQLKKIQIKKYKFILNEQHELSFFLLLKPTFKDKRQNCNKKCTFKPNFDNTDKTIRLLIV